MSEQSSRLAVALADRYAIERELGAGGMATVYLAHDVKHDRKVAVKVLKPELAAVLGAERFLNEIKVTANLQHPHILPLHDSGEAEGFVYYVMPYVEGESLRAKLEREKELSIEETVEITKAVASALDYAHRHEVIHRDIKPENILLHEGQPVVADFGIALAVSAAGGARLTETGLSLGTPQYMSPEQAMGDRELDGRSDIYSLACVTYEMLAGEAPYTGPTAQAIVAKIVTEEPRPVAQSRKTVPAHMDLAIRDGAGAHGPGDPQGARQTAGGSVWEGVRLHRCDHEAGSSHGDFDCGCAAGRAAARPAPDRCRHCRMDAGCAVASRDCIRRSLGKARRGRVGGAAFEHNVPGFCTARVRRTRARHMAAGTRCLSGQPDDRLCRSIRFVDAPARTKPGRSLGPGHAGYGRSLPSLLLTGRGVDWLLYGARVEEGPCVGGATHPAGTGSSDSDGCVMGRRWANFGR
jgi:tRNA A-37 threonylcarbamoyl transferase component Bud32